ncbi:tripartite tricarboxylate transporter permease [Sporosarcina thermotolerans]|uniref:Tripartite tricarboxylate transporter permease n=1 Tax=Sporosarcina thermotolerans TaxID=633404 RepID=A0AAW9A791_9BACL|nr:tripartite tricarboxylate transporter permease [Sporosarcina thermotolerans]MDW0116190.1 tripartite tricarboxylate transporter permease [Sporosarcina thermotolerans]WHT48166.1 tripartite tricarboxylate transporter permease [Sporosarcina thermotolerans]
MDLLLNGFAQVFHPSIFILIMLGVIAGIVIGALPGLTATMGVALFLPITFGMDPVAGLLLLVGVYFGGVYGGSIASILLNTPGTPASAATALDGYPFTKQGKAGKALGISVIAASTGGIFSVIMLIFISPQLAQIALDFSAPEMFGLALFGLSIISSISGGSVLKGLISGVFGLVICTVGMDPMTSYPRFTYDNISLLNGLNFIPVMIGLFAISEALVIMEEQLTGGQGFKKIIASYALPKWNELKKLWGTILRSSGIGTFIGIIPGAGADIAAFVAYNEAKRFSKKEEKETFGKGNPKGIAAPEAAGNALTGGAFVPLLTLGIPGDAVTAIMLGALVVQGIQPGPQLFETSGDLVYTLFSGMLVANVLMLIFGLLGIRLFTTILKVPKNIIAPVIIVLSVVGSFAIANNYFDVFTMLGAGIIGYFMKKFGFPASPIVLALILGPMAESEMRRALVMSEGSYMIFLQRPISLTFIILAIVSLVVPLIMGKIKSKKAMSK